jgi:alkylglycerol monooxygenase
VKGFDPIVLAVPLYLLGMVVEGAISRRRRLGLYVTDDTLNNLACGLYQQLMVVLAAGLLLAPYRWVYDHARLTDWWGAHPVAAWATAFVLSDFFYYWFHRWSHESAIGWFSHVVHHQSEEYNLSVALRQDAWQPFFSLWFYLPVAWLGIPPAVFATAYGVVIVYQYWIHTRLIDRIGPLEWVLNTPSHHRVHHGVNPSYLDKNYAGVFIVWDRWFGTFEPEGVAPTYGTIEPLASFNPVWSHLQYGVKLGLKAASMPSAWTALQALVRSPGWVPPGRLAEDFHAHAAARLGAPKYNVTVDPARRRWVVVSFALAMVVGTVPLAAPMPKLHAAAVALVSVWGLANVAGVAEARRWARASEGARLVLVAVVAALAAVALRQPWWLAAGAVAWVLRVWLHRVVAAGRW